MSEAACRFELDVDGLDGFFAAYEDERRAAGLGATLCHVTPQQRIDALEIIVGLNACGGWRRRDDDSAEALFLRYLRPLLAETRQSGAALEAAVGRCLPGRFDVPLAQAAGMGGGGGATVVTGTGMDTGGAKTAVSRLRLAWLHLRALLLTRWKTALAMAAGLAALAALAVFPGSVAILCYIAPASCALPPLQFDLPQDPAGRTAAPANANTSAPQPSNPDQQAYREALSLILDAAAQSPDGITPRELASILTGHSQSISEPAVTLAALLRAHPLPADTTISLDAPGGLAMRSYAGAAAALERGLPLDHFSDPADEAAALHSDAALQARLGTAYPSAPADAAQAGGGVVARLATAATWPVWTRWLAGLPLPVFALWLLTQRRRLLRAALHNAATGQRGAPVEIDFGPIAASTPPPSRDLARKLLQREPYPSRRLHGLRSVEATLARGGYMTPVWRPASRAADYVFLIKRRDPNDQERARALRLVDALRRGGALLSVYDYDPDPRALMPLDAGGKGAKLDLRALRELHPQARLVVISDGRELVDFFTRQPLLFVARELRQWPARMLLTPVPVGDWGEVEMNLSEALDGLIGRATQEGFADLAAGLASRAQNPPHRAALERARQGGAQGGLAAKVVTWLQSARRSVATDVSPARPPAIRFDDPALMSDAPPLPAERGQIIASLYDWLEPDGFFWLAACCHYPQLRFSITVYLGLALAREGGDAPLFDERLLSRLTLLPWFRVGRMPPWLRSAVFAGIRPTRQAAVRAAVARLLARQPPRDGSGLTAAIADPLALTIWRPDGRGLDAPVDAVMADILLDGAPASDGPELEGAAFEMLFGAARRVFWRQMRLAFYAALAWCGWAWQLWPGPAAAPHAPGAWWPLLLFAALSLAAAGAPVALRLYGRLKPAAPVAPRQAAAAAPPVDPPAKELAA